MLHCNKYLCILVITHLTKETSMNNWQPMTDEDIKWLNRRPQPQPII